MLSPDQRADRLSKVATMRYDLLSCRGYLRDCQSIARQCAGMTDHRKKKTALWAVSDDLQPLIDDLGRIIEFFTSEFPLRPNTTGERHGTASNSAH